MNALQVLGVVFGVVGGIAFLAFLVWFIYSGIRMVREKEIMIIEHWGVYEKKLLPGLHWINPFSQRPKAYNERYVLTDDWGTPKVVERKGLIRIMTQDQVLDFPKQLAITRDNASVYIDAVLNYRVVEAQVLVYAVQNLPHVLSKLLQAQIRNVVGSLDLDQVIEEPARLNVLTEILQNDARRWGVRIVFVKVQKVETSAHGMSDVLALKKNADLRNKEIIIQSRAQKQTAVIEAEGHRDGSIRRSEGEAQEILSRARGQAQAIINAAQAEARSIKDIGRAISAAHGSPARYLLVLKYLEALRKVVACPSTEVKFVPEKAKFAQVASSMGMNVAIPPGR